MKNKKLTFLKIAVIAALGIATIMGCEKKEEIKTEIKVNQEYQMERRFLSISLSAPLEAVIYDKENEQFVVYGWYKLSLKEVHELYANANEYKLKYEN